jgi:hypothetical protein
MVGSSRADFAGADQVIADEASEFRVGARQAGGTLKRRDEAGACHRNGRARCA